MFRSLAGEARKRSRRGLMLGGGLAAALIVAGLSFWRMRDRAPPCEVMVASRDTLRAAMLCEARYERDGDSLDLLWAARAHVIEEDWKSAERVALRVLRTARYGDAHSVLGYIALRKELPAAARVHAQAALGAHLIGSDARGQASDHVVISQTALQIGDYETALAAADRAIALVEKLGSSAPRIPAYLARADALRWMGDNHSAVATLRGALAWAHKPCEKAWVRLRNGIAQMSLQQDAIAEAELAMAEQQNAECGDKAVARQISVNQAWLIHKRDPEGALARLDAVHRAKSEEDVEAKMLRAYVAADRADLQEVARNLQKAAMLEHSDAHWPWIIALVRAELLEVHGGLLNDVWAMLFYRSSTAMVAALRSNARARSAYLVASYRAPYDGLISIWARYGRWREVLAMVLELDASDMLRATANEETLRTQLQGGQGANLTALHEALAKHVALALPSVDAVLEAWRGRELVILAARSPRSIGGGKERVYRLHLRDGEVTGVDAGDAEQARKWTDALYQNAGDEEAARGLGELIAIPGGRGRETARLDVLAIGALGKVPLAALRDANGALSTDRRPLVRVLALRATTPEAVGDDRAVVLADPRGDLSAAITEGLIVVGALAAEKRARQVQLYGSVTEPATLARLREASGAGLLHVAGHVGVEGRWRVLQLSGKDEINPAQLVQQGIAPRVAVLASCGSAAARDEEGWGSVASALLEAGTSMVVATDRSVPDGYALLLMQEFYSQPDWRTEPARALARAQGKMSKRVVSAGEGAPGAHTWASFVVLGRPPVVLERKVAQAERGPR